MVIRTELTKMQIARNVMIAFSSFIGLAIILIWMFFFKACTLLFFKNVVLPLKEKAKMHGRDDPKFDADIASFRNWGHVK